jgi:hypothetical protein
MYLPVFNYLECILLTDSTKQLQSNIEALLLFTPRLLPGVLRRRHHSKEAIAGRSFVKQINQGTALRSTLSYEYVQRLDQRREVNANAAIAWRVKKTILVYVQIRVS